MFSRFISVVAWVWISSLVSFNHVMHQLVKKIKVIKTKIPACFPFVLNCPCILQWLHKKQKKKTNKQVSQQTNKGKPRTVCFSYLTHSKHPSQQVIQWVTVYLLGPASWYTQICVFVQLSPWSGLLGQGFQCRKDFSAPQKCWVWQGCSLTGLSSCPWSQGKSWVLTPAQQQDCCVPQFPD